jgi:hypothetical protein
MIPPAAAAAMVGTALRAAMVVMALTVPWARMRAMLGKTAATVAMLGKAVPGVLQDPEAQVAASPALAVMARAEMAGVVVRVGPAATAVPVLTELAAPHPANLVNLGAAVATQVAVEPAGPAGLLAPA